MSDTTTDSGLNNNGHGLLVDALGRYGYRTQLTGTYVCYTCGHMCDQDLHHDTLIAAGADYCETCYQYSDGANALIHSDACNAIPHDVCAGCEFCND